jgi:hypothetical protein
MIFRKFWLKDPPFPENICLFWGENMKKGKENKYNKTQWRKQYANWQIIFCF